MGSTVSRIDNKRQRINGNGSIKRNQSNIRSKILRILVNSSYVGVHDLGRLVQLSKSMKIAIYKDKNLFAIAFEHTYGMPRDIQDMFGRRRLLQQLGNKEIYSTEPEHPPILPPGLSQTDVILTGELYFHYHDKKRRQLVRGFASSRILSDFYRKDKGTIQVYFEDPVILSDVNIYTEPIRGYDGDVKPGFVSLYPSYKAMKKCSLHIRLIRRSDTKSCSIHYDNSSGPICRVKPKVMPLDRSKDAEKVAESDDINKLDFESGTKCGYIDLQSDEYALPFKKTAKAALLKSRFPYSICFQAGLDLKVNSEKKITVIGFDLKAYKFVGEDHGWVPFEEESRSLRYSSRAERVEYPNNGVTVGHVLSDLLYYK